MTIGPFNAASPSPWQLALQSVDDETIESSREASGGEMSENAQALQAFEQMWANPAPAPLPKPYRNPPPPGSLFNRKA
jgi:hypothetical protein